LRYQTQSTYDLSASIEESLYSNGYIFKNRFSSLPGNRQAMKTKVLGTLKMIAEDPDLKEYLLYETEKYKKYWTDNQENSRYWHSYFEKALLQNEPISLVKHRFKNLSDITLQEIKDYLISLQSSPLLECILAPP
jgi:hypothetical protein